MKISAAFLILVLAPTALGHSSEEIHSSGKWRDAPDSFFDDVGDSELESAAIQDDLPSEEPETPQATQVPDPKTNKESTIATIALTESPTMSPTSFICAEKNKPCFDVITSIYTECCDGMKCHVRENKYGEVVSMCDPSTTAPPTSQPTATPTKAPTMSPTASIYAKENEACFDMDTLTYTECEPGLKCHVDRSEDGDFGTKCAPDDVVSASIDSKKALCAHKDITCYELEETLDNYYTEIRSILDQIDDEPFEQDLGLQVDFLCKNLDPTDPGLRDLASFARFDFIEKCSQWDAAYCEAKLAQAVKYGKLLYRRLQHGKIGYLITDIKELPKKEAEGYHAEFYCEYFDYPPFLYKPLPFLPSRLNETCGEADYEYYVE